jgi:glutathione S-transferase
LLPCARSARGRVAGNRDYTRRRPSAEFFCHGDGPTVADICLVTQVTPAKTFNLSLDPYPRVVRIHDTCMAIPAFADAHPSKQPDAE